MAPEAPRMPARVAIADPARLADCRTLWLALRDHHGDTEPGMGGLRDDEDSWQRSSATFAKAFSAGEGFLVLAEAPDGAPDAPLACAIVTIRDGSPIWTVSERIADLEVLAAAPAARGLGIGRAVLDEVAAELARRGVGETRLVVTAGNVGAQAFYRELGFDTFALVMRRTA